MFKLAACPHCKLALRYMEELTEAHPEWGKIPVTFVDEGKEPELADQYDYYFVPTYYVGGVKVHEGHAEKADVERVFRAAMEESAAE